MAEDVIKNTVQVYDKIAPEFAQKWFHVQSVEPRILSFLSLLEPKASVLDLGCGCGRDVLTMQKKGVDVVGIDLSSAMILEARRRVPGSIFRQMDARQLSYPKDTFSGIWTCAVLLHMPDKEIRYTLSEIWRVLKPAGILAMTVQEGEGKVNDPLSRYKRLFSLLECKTLLGMAGFTILNVHSTMNHTCSDKPTVQKKWIEIIARKEVASKIQNSDSGCLLCSDIRFDINRREGLPGASSIIWGNNELFLSVDIAPVVHGHLLLTTEAHYACYGESPAYLDKVILANMQRIDSLFRQAYGVPPIFCEHGPASPKKAGACIGHAHLHCLPSSISIGNILEPIIGKGIPATFMYWFSRNWTNCLSG
jgi:ubiquinone/menaquinone biosynthesis C-methylase UbiE/diadenosine tetraphosphate (Ap4A) HIT family hydrolase